MRLQTVSRKRFEVTFSSLQRDTTCEAFGNLEAFNDRKSTYISAWETSPSAKILRENLVDLPPGLEQLYAR
jgi:hypothetical protein